MRPTLVLWLGLSVTALARAEEPPVPIGVATVDITPTTPIRLVGYGSRKTESEGVDARLKAKALAIGGDAQGGSPGPAVLIAVDNLGIPATIADEVARRLEAKAGLPRDRLAVCATHTHSGPAVDGGLDIIFGGPLPADQRGRISAYTRALTDNLERVALEALAARRPGRLSWAQGSAGFAANRRVIKDGKWVNFGVNPAGPTDRSLPVLRVSDPDGTTRAVLIGYACHCTTLGGEYNKVGGDWAGYACESVEADHPGATAMVIVGCGGDANPEPRRNVDDAKKHGREVADEVKRLLGRPMAPLPGTVAARFRRIEVPLGPPPTREALTKGLTRPGSDGYFARLMLAKLDRGEALPRSFAYPVQAWAFGDSLAMVFLGGEVVVDYALRLKREGAGDRLWVVAYSNDVPCYIASKRMLPEGGYEVDSSMIYYGQPTRLAPEAEDTIIAAARGLLPPAFATKK